MMISQPALLCLTATWQRLTGRFASEADAASLHVPSSPAAEAITAEDPHAAETVMAAVVAADPGPTRRLTEDQTASEVDPNMPLTANERRARAAALRGMALSRGRRFDAAGAAFAEAARLDPMLDLTRTPTFWKLERAAHEAAIAAYLHVGRERDAAVLRARVQSTFRPKPLRPRQQVVLSP